MGYYNGEWYLTFFKNEKGNNDIASHEAIAEVVVEMDYFDDIPTPMCKIKLHNNAVLMTKMYEKLKELRDTCKVDDLH